jgi:VWFA-related protein
MKLRVWAVLLAVLSPAQEPPVFRSTAEEVLVDFVVRDRRGRQVAGLRPDEVEILEEGVPQALKVLRRIEGLQATEWQPGGQQTARQLDPNRNVKLVLLVFDQLSTEGRAMARRAVEDLMRLGIPPNTFYAVVQLDPSFRIVQPFTNEPYLVKWAAERVTGVKGARSEGAPAIGQGTREATSGDYAASAMAAAVAEMESRAAELEREQRGAAAFNGLLSMVLGLRRLEGRKNAILFSEGIAGAGALARTVIAQANRNNVAFYTIDARGLRAGQVMPASDPSLPPAAVAARAPLLEELAVETGGLAIAGTNDLRSPLRQAAEDAGAYYLASYTPQNTHWDGKFRRLEVRVKRPGVQVQARSGYFALPPGMQALLFPHEVPLLRALSANPAPKQVGYRAGMLRFGPAPQGKVQCAFQIEIPIRELSVRRNEAAGTYDVHASFLVFVKDAQGQAVRKATRDVPFSGPLDKLAAFQAGDFIYNDHFPLPPGRYIMESAVADRLGERVGAKRVAFVVPGVREGVPALSSIVLAKRVEPNPPEEVRYGEGDDRGPNPLRFRGGMVTPMLENTVRDRLGVYFTVHAPPGGRPAAVIEILKDGAVLSRAEAELIEEEGRFTAFAVAPLGEAQPGDYEVRVTVSAGGRTVAETRGFSVAP